MAGRQGIPAIIGAILMDPDASAAGVSPAQASVGRVEMNDTVAEVSAADLGWRFGIGVALIFGGYGGWALIPVVTGSGMSVGVKSALAGILALMPLLGKVAAVAVMGKPGFNLLKKYLSKYLGGLWPDQVSRARYNAGLWLFVASLLFGALLPYLPGLLVDWNSNEALWSLVSDVGIIVSLLMLGGEFWSKMMALFKYDAKVV
jgi:hypothetical protein